MKMNNVCLVLLIALVASPGPSTQSQNWPQEIAKQIDTAMKAMNMTRKTTISETLKMPFTFVFNVDGMHPCFDIWYVHGYKIDLFGGSIFEALKKYVNICLYHYHGKLSTNSIGSNVPNLVEYFVEVFKESFQCYNESGNVTSPRVKRCYRNRLSWDNKCHGLAV